MRKIEVVMTNERLIGAVGLALVGEILGKSYFIKKCNRIRVTDKKGQPQIKNGDIFLTYIGLLCQGKTHYEAVREIEDDPEYYKLELGISYAIPSAETLRQRFDEIGNSLSELIRQGNVEMFKSFLIEPTSLVNGLVPVDIDVTPMDNSKTSKEGVSRTYKNYDGFAPIMAYIGAEGYFINCELREGKQHCQKNTPEFLVQTLKLCHEITNKQLLVRLDAGNDASVNLGILIEDGSKFNIKRNLRTKETKFEWLEFAIENSQNVSTPREGKNVYIGSTQKDVTYINNLDENITKSVRVCYEVIERTIDKYGQILLQPTIEVNTFWTNLDCCDEEVIKLYHKHGESEQFHSEIKSDMGVERLPSGKFDTNKLVLDLTMIAYNILRFIGQESLNCKYSPKTKRPIKRRRLKTVIEKLILMVGHVTSHSRKTILSLGVGDSNSWRLTFLELFQKFSSI